MMVMMTMTVLHRIRAFRRRSSDPRDSGQMTASDWGYACKHVSVERLSRHLKGDLDLRTPALRTHDANASSPLIHRSILTCKMEAEGKRNRK